MSWELDGQERGLSTLVVRDDEGRVRVMAGVVVTVFFQNQLSKAVRQAVIDVAEDYLRRTGEHVRWALPTVDEESCSWISKGRSPESWLPTYLEGMSWAFDVHAGECESEACAFRICGFGSEIDDTGGLGYLHVSFPLSWFAEHQATFPEYVLKLCQRVRPLSGYAGVGILEMHETVDQNIYQVIPHAFGKRFPGLEIEDRIGHTNSLHAGIKGVNWLTILGDKWIQKMGGLDSLRAALGDDDAFGVFPYDGGVLIQAGPKPQLGDSEADRWPLHYVNLARALKKVQIKHHYPFHREGPWHMGQQATMEWLFRFDGN